MQKERRKLIIPFLAPALIVYLVFFIYPTIQALWVSLNDWSGFTPQMDYVGLANFEELLRDKVYQQVLLQSLGLLVFGGILTFALSLFFTGLLGTGVRGRRFFRAVIFSPNVVAMIALTTLWSFVYNPRFGMLNGVLKAIGLDKLGRTAWMGPDLVYWAVLVAVVWIYVGFYAILFIAGADKIPQSLYDAAIVEGANRIQMFFKVTLPLMWDVVAVGLVLWIIDALMQFEFYYAISGAFPPIKIWTIPIYVFVLAFGKRNPIFRMGYGTAVAVSLLVFVIAFVLITRVILRRREAVEF
jgi:ABC-type sugar transport system permease subunit